MLLFITLSIPVAVMAQATFGNITGTVTDASGAVVPNVPVSIRDLERGVVIETKTNGDGNFTQTHLLAGRYEVKINAPGFVAFSATSVVQVDTTTRMDAVLNVGGDAILVNVNDEAPLLKTDRADVSTTLTSSELGKLPILIATSLRSWSLCPAQVAALNRVPEHPARKISRLISKLRQRSVSLFERLPAGWYRKP